MRDRRKFWRAAGVVGLATASACTLAWGLGAGRAVRDAFAALTTPKQPDVVYVATPQPVVDQMLELAMVQPGDVVYDLGCGDGRVVVTAAKRYGVKAVGFDVDPKRVAEARENVRKNGVSNLVTIHQQDVFQADLSGATVVTMYLLPYLNVQLMPRLARLKPGSRIVSHGFDMKGAKPKAVEPVREPSLTNVRSVYLWVVPWEAE